MSHLFEQPGRFHCSSGLRVSNPRRSRFRVWLGLVSYVFAAAIVPPGHMAASLADGTPFHLCPGDLRSAQVLDAVVLHTSVSTNHSHHHSPEGHAPDAELSKTAAAPGCLLAGSGAETSPLLAEVFEPSDSAQPSVTVAVASACLPCRWLRPASRSPPL